MLRSKEFTKVYYQIEDVYQIVKNKRQNFLDPTKELDKMIELHQKLHHLAVRDIERERRTYKKHGTPDKELDALLNQISTTRRRKHN